jgi:transposase-like protein
VSSKLDTEDFVCLNPSCPDYNRRGRENIILASAIKTKRKEPIKRWHCKTCNHYFAENQGNFRYRLRADKEELVRLVDYYLREHTITSIAAMLGRDPRTISNWLGLLTAERAEAIDFLERECGLSSDQIEWLREKYLSRRNPK